MGNLCCIEIEENKKQLNILEQYKKMKSKKNNPKKKIEKSLKIIENHKEEIKRLEELIKDESLKEETKDIYKEQIIKYESDVIKNQKIIEEQYFILSSKYDDYESDEKELTQNIDGWSRIPLEKI